MILDTDQSDAGISPMNQCMGIVQHFPSHSGLTLFELFQIGCPLTGTVPSDVGAIVVIAQYGENTVGSMELLEYVFDTVQFRGAVIDQVSRKDNEIALLSVYEIDELLDTTGITGNGSDVQVRELYDAVTVEGFREVSRFKRDFFDLIAMPSANSAVKYHCHAGQSDKQTGGCTNCSCGFP